MEVEFGKWGNSIALRIPAKVAKASGIAPGVQAEITVKNGALVIKPTPKKKISRKQRLALMLSDLDKHGPMGEIDWGGEVGKEIVEW